MAGRRSFLDLPTEIRLQIYHQLLVSYGNHSNCTVKYSKAILHIRGAKNGTNPSTVGLFRATEFKWTTYNYPHPAIVSTCRKIAAEATAILYRENTFQFHCGSSNDLAPPPSALGVQTLCDRLFTTLNSENWSSDVPFALESCDFAAFLNAIGPTNASTITSLSFYGSDADSVAGCMPAVTELIASHMPKLRGLDIHVASRMVFWNESPDYFHPDHSSPFWANGAFWPLYRTLQDFVHKVTWLKRLEYKGQEDFCEFRWGLEGYEKLKALEDWVKSRAES